MFRRRRTDSADVGKAKVRRTSEDIYDEGDDLDDLIDDGGDGGDADGSGETGRPAAEKVSEDVAAVRDRAPQRERPARTAGPFDEADVESDPVDHVARIDFGGIRVPVTDDAEIRVEVEEKSGSVRSVSVVHEQGNLQLGAFAAPRSEGIWDEVRETMRSSLAGTGGTVDDHDGPFGTELRAQVPVEDGKRRGTQRVRFIGVDGPRWFFRGVLTGPAADDDTAARPLLDIFRDCVVVRGNDPRAPHEPLPLTMPVDAERVDDEGAAARPADNPFRRGPEITEIR